MSAFYHDHYGAFFGLFMAMMLMGAIAQAKMVLRLEAHAPRLYEALNRPKILTNSFLVLRLLRRRRELEALDATTRAWTYLYLTLIGLLLVFTAANFFLIDQYYKDHPYRPRRASTAVPAQTSPPPPTR